MIFGNELLAFLAEDIPAMETDMEGKLKGGFSAFGDGGAMSLLGNVNCDCGCTENGDCGCNACDDMDCNCGCVKNKKCTPKSDPKPNPDPLPTTTPKPQTSFVGFGGSFLF